MYGFHARSTLICIVEVNQFMNKEGIPAGADGMVDNVRIRSTAVCFTVELLTLMRSSSTRRSMSIPRLERCSHVRGISYELMSE